MSNLINGGRVQGYGRKQERKRQKAVEICKEKAELLLLKSHLSRNIKWPVRAYTRGSKSFRSGKTNRFTTIEKDYASKVHVDKFKNFKAQPWDPKLTPKSSLPRQVFRKSVETNYDNDIDLGLESYVDSFLKNQNIQLDENSADLMKKLSMQLMDRVIMNMANPHNSTEKNPTTTEKPLDWEFVLANILSTQLPSTVIDRVHKHMELLTGKSAPAIAAMNVTRTPLSDLTISDSEREMKEAITQISNEVEDNAFEIEDERDEQFVADVTWLMRASRAEKAVKEQQLHFVHDEYTSRALDLKSAFF